MKRPTPSRSPMNWAQFEFAVQHSAAADSLQDLSLKRNYDPVDDRVPVDMILQRMTHCLN